MEDFDVPPFFVDCLYSLCITAKIATQQIENARTAIFVFKDLSESQNRKINSGNPDFNGFFFCEVNSIYALATALLFIFQA